MIRIILLCEDRQMSAFARRFLFRRNFSSRQVKSMHSSGLGSGEKWVRDRFPRQLRIVRKRRRTFLIAMIDADSGSTANRRSQLVRNAENRGLPRPRRMTLSSSSFQEGISRLGSHILQVTMSTRQRSTRNCLARTTANPLPMRYMTCAMSPGNCASLCLFRWWKRVVSTHS